MITAHRLLTATVFLALAGCSGISIADLRPNFDAVPRPTPAVAPAPMPAPAVMTAKERLVAAIEGQGCELNASNGAAVMSDATIGADELRTLIPQLQTEGRVEVVNGGAIRVISPQCA